TLSKVAYDAELSLIELALAFVLEHPAISSAIIGPRTMEQLESHLSAPETLLDAAVLDRIDEIVPAWDEPQHGRRRVESASAEQGTTSAAPLPLRRMS